MVLQRFVCFVVVFLLFNLFIFFQSRNVLIFPLCRGVVEGGRVKKGGGKERGDEKATRREEEEKRTQEIKTFSYREASVRGLRSPAIGTKKLTHVYAHTQFNQRGGEAAIIIIIFFLKSLSLLSTVEILAFFFFQKT